MEKEEICLRLMELMRVETINHNLFLAKNKEIMKKNRGKLKENISSRNTKSTKMELSIH
jgi:hypothetical protein